LTLVANSRLLATIPKIRRPPHEEFGPDGASCEFAITVKIGVKPSKQMFSFPLDHIDWGQV
jgi:hypothetical protein